METVWEYYRFSHAIANSIVWISWVNQTINHFICILYAPYFSCSMCAQANLEIVLGGHVGTDVTNNLTIKSETFLTVS
jgi:deoxycytidylate deaminase